MRRSLVVTDETAGHPFLATLPPHVREGLIPIPTRVSWVVTGDDVRGFLGAYVACLLAVGIFIA